MESRNYSAWKQSYFIAKCECKSPTGVPNEYLNTAEIMNSDQFDPDSTPGNGITTEDDYDSISVTPVIVMADLSISKTALNQNNVYDVGATVIFTVTVKNDGPANASGVMVKDLLPPGFTYLTSSPTSGLYNYITGVWNVGNIANGTDQSLDIYTRVNPPSGTANDYTNVTEVIASNLPDPDSTPNNGVTTEDDYDSLTINVAVADLSLEKTVNNKNANVNEVVTFTPQPLTMKDQAQQRESQLKILFRLVTRIFRTLIMVVFLV